MKRKNIKEEIKEYFFMNPSVKMRVRQIERELKIPLPSVIGWTSELEKERILRKTRIANVVFYSADRVSRDFLLEKRLFNIKKLHDSGLIDCLITELSNPTIIVFGSYSKGEDVENSDIDLYIETPSRRKINLEKFEEHLKRGIHVFSHKNIREIKNVDLANNIVNGVILNGFLEVL